MTDRKLKLAGWIAAALLATGPAFATASEPAGPAKAATSTDLSGVTVTGPQAPSPVVNAASQFVRSHVPTSRNEQYARFHDPICVKVIGMPAEFDAFVAQRIVELARAVNAPIDPSASCSPNVDVIFSSEPQAQLSDIAKRRDVLFGYYLHSEIKKLTTFSRPVQSWYLTRSRDTHGDNILELYDPAPCVSSPKGICDLKAPALTGRAGSRLGNDMSSELVHSLVIADANKLSGEKIGAVADYIAVLALSRWQGLERCNSMSTILNLMADGCEGPPDAATPGDLAMLRGLYMVASREAGALQRAEIAGRLQTALKASPDAEQH